MTLDTATGPDIQLLGEARAILQGVLARAGGEPLVRIRVGRG